MIIRPYIHIITNIVISISYPAKPVIFSLCRCRCEIISGIRILASVADPRPESTRNEVSTREKTKIRPRHHNLAGISRIEIATRTVTLLRRPPEMIVFGNDGLYTYKGGLVGVQNAGGMSRISYYELSSDGLAIAKLDVLIAGQAEGTLRTTGVIADDGFYFLHFSRWGSPEESLIKPQIRRLKLP